MSKSRKHIVFVHLLNDYSGSPLILSQVINALDPNEYEKTLITSQKGKIGFLSDLDQVQEKYFWYRWMANPWLRLITFSLSQFFLFLKLFQYWRKDVVFYVNTLLPFGAGLAGKLMGKKVIYHVHETSMKPVVLKKFLRMVAAATAQKVIHVSKYMEKNESLPGTENMVVYNTLPANFIETAAAYQPADKTKLPFRVLMLCSLKDYKGVDEFVALSRRLPGLSFELVLNATQEEVDKFFLMQMNPANIQMHAAQKNVHPFYQHSSLLLNLSHPDKWIETFGMTVLEGMYYRLPVIVPPVGGIAELVEEGKNGYHADSRNLGPIVLHIQELVANRQLYQEMSEAAYRQALTFTGSHFKQQIGDIIDSLYSKPTIPNPISTSQYKPLSS
jgi:glycosyltransferase involved in cell wall biosynthesis